MGLTLALSNNSSMQTKASLKSVKFVNDPEADKMVTHYIPDLMRTRGFIVESTTIKNENNNDTRE